MRYSLLVEDGKVVTVNLEEMGAKSYKFSGPQTILNELEELKGQSA
jgi:peroxiredoxin